MLNPLRNTMFVMILLRALSSVYNIKHCLSYIHKGDV